MYRFVASALAMLFFAGMTGIVGAQGKGISNRSTELPTAASNASTAAARQAALDRAAELANRDVGTRPTESGPLSVGTGSAAEQASAARQTALDRARALSNRNVGTRPTDVGPTSTGVGASVQASAARQSALDRARELSSRNVGSRPTNVGLGQGTRGSAALQAALNRARVFKATHNETGDSHIGRGLSSRPDDMTAQQQAAGAAAIERATGQLHGAAQRLTERQQTFRSQLSDIEAMRDQAIDTANVRLLQQADRLEQQLRGAANGHGVRQAGFFTPGLGRETARLARGVSVDVPAEEYWDNFAPGTPGFGRRTADGRRDMTDPDMSEPPATEPPVIEPPLTEPPVDEPMADEAADAAPTPDFEPAPEAPMTDTLEGELERLPTTLE